MKTRISSQTVKILSLLLAACMLAAAGVPAFAGEDEFVKVAEAAVPYVVAVKTDKGEGSGFIVKHGKDYFVVTNNHVVNGAREIKAILSDESKYACEIHGKMDEADIAALKMKDVNGELATATLGDSDKLRVGEKVAAISNPFGLGFTVTAGIISATKRKGPEGLKYDEFIQTDAAINPGNSGGPLVNLKGEVVGINTFIIATAGKGVPASAGLGFAIPVNAAKSIIGILLKGGKPTSLRDPGIMCEADVDEKHAVEEAGPGGSMPPSPAPEQEGVACAQNYDYRDANVYVHMIEKVLPKVAAMLVGKERIGSAVIVFEGKKNERYLVTTYDLVQSEREVLVAFRVKHHDEEKIVTTVAEVVGVDKPSNLAVIKIEAEKAPLPIAFAKVDRTPIGSRVLAVGTPFGLTFTVTSGVLSAKNARIGPGYFKNFLLTDAAINWGNSGGPLVNMKGELVGLNVFVPGFAEQAGMSFAVPANMVYEIAQELIRKGKVTRGYVGVEEMRKVSEEERGKFNIPANTGVYVGKVAKGSPAEKGGLQADMIIVRFARDEVSGPEELKVMIAAIRPKEWVKIVVIDKDGKEKELNIRTEELKDD